ncbi:uncharacterized protein [Diabrotica undecimpunctata]|uniref:uncharacterized protein n=1 Tax=Diabrotica undecimpunctata TaxID=50387 RepID=UPI003B636C4C
MKYNIVFAFCLAVAAAIPVDVAVDEEGQEYLLVPVFRERRDVKWGANQGGFGASSSGTLLNNNNHRVDGTATESKAWGSHGVKPDSFGGRVDYSHKPSGSSGFVNADRTPGYGTDVTAGGKYNIAGGKNWGADVNANYGRHFGGPGGTGKPQAGAGLNVHGNF